MKYLEYQTYEAFLVALNEGLIKTHNITQHSNTLLNTLSGYKILNSSINIIDKHRFDLSFDITLKNKEAYDLVINIINNFGYYPSTIIGINNLQRKSSRISYTHDNYKNLLNQSIRIILRCESIFDDTWLNSLPIPDFLYHITYGKYIDKILKNGLFAKSKHRISNHPDRIHFTYSRLEAWKLIKSFDASDIFNNKEKQHYVILQIDCRSKIFKNKLILHTDPNFQTGCFTYDNISPQYIKVL